MIHPRLLSAALTGAACTILIGCRSRDVAPAVDASAPRMRPAEVGASSAVYFTLRNPGADTLILTGAEIDVAGSAGMHQSMDHDGMASMHPLDSVVVLPRDSVVFSERGLHVMANGLRAALDVGDTVAVRLRFRGTRVDTLWALVRE